jgi:hypothetical protein
MTSNKVSTVLAAALIASAHFSVQAQTVGAGAGAGAATSAAQGAITQNMVLGAVAGLAVIAALNSGDSGAVASPINQASTAAANSANTAVTKADSALIAAKSVATIVADSGINTSGLSSAITALETAKQNAQAAASDLAVASRTIAMVTNNGKVICAASVCTNAEILGLSFKAASTAKVAADAALYVANLIQSINTLAATNSNLSTAAKGQLTALLETARVASLESQTAANQSVQAYQDLLAAQGTTGTTITASTGTTGTIGATGTVR